MNNSLNILGLPELKQTSEILASMTSELGSQKFSTVLSTSREQLLLAREGNPILRFGVATDDASLDSGAGIELIEKFVENFENFRHPVIFYDNPIIARRIEFQYMKIGLQNGECCVYVISDDDVESPESIRKQMDSFGIDTAHYVKNDHLRFVKIDDPARDPQGFVLGSQKILDSLPLHKTRLQRVRMVAHMKYQFNTREEIDGHSEIERFVDSNFGNFNDSLLCSHYIGKYGSETHGDWVRKLLQIHGVSLVVCSEKNSPAMFKDNNLFVPSKSRVVLTGKSQEIIGDIESEINELSFEELERNISEIKNEILFLTSQVGADLGDYEPDSLRSAIAKISLLKRKEAMMDARRGFLIW